ncbi:hypothetical protein F8N49_05560 [Pseudomonas sp. GXM4]|nr:hypothetical protein F8N49_05560 [Pseudomonas sp. GXM4]
MSRSCSLFNHAGSKAPHPSPLPEGEGADRGVLRHASTWKTEVIVALGSVKNAQVGVDLEHPPISPLALWEGEGRLGCLALCIDLETEVIVALGSVKNAQVGVDFKHHPISHLALWEGEGRPRCLASCIDLEDRGDYGFGFSEERSGRRRSRASPNQSPLPLGEG